MPAQPFASSLTWRQRVLVVSGLLLAVPAIANDIVFYERDGFQGRSFVSDETISNFASFGFNDRASSVVIRRGSWQLCSDAYFRGRCVTLPPGEYPTLRSMQLENQISSARELGWNQRPPGGGGPGGGGPRPSVEVELFEGNAFAGRVFPVNSAVNNFPSEFNDRANSMIIHDGYWEACEHEGYRGACQVYGPGRYANLGAMTNRISSLRPVAAPGPAADTGGWGSGARAMLYEGQHLSGRSMVINNDVIANLAGTGFNDRAASLRIEGGYWMFCSDANFTGECQTFGPGDYATLPWGLSAKISSGRRIREHYPYNQNPNWQR